MSQRFESSIEVRPTLIVGLGGTGTLICQWAHELLDQLPGRLPPFIKFVAFDTDRQEEGGPRKLPREDFFNLFEDLELSEVLRDFNRLPEFHSHLRWLKDMQLDAGAAGCGCQGLNRLGRAVFFELRERIHQIVAARLAALNDTDALLRLMEPLGERYSLGRGNAPAIHVAGSVCGGTGSGMLLDLAYNLRFWANDEFHKNADLIAHLVLPEAFPVNSERIKDKLRTVAFATLQQIELLTDSNRRNLNVQYPNNTTKSFENLTAPFDYTYLLSGTAPGRGTDRRHLSQMIARMIRAMTAEPASTPIFADANNKQLDILTQRAEPNKRRLCFASYGLRYGIPGALTEDRNFKRDAAAAQNGQNDRIGLVKRWICEDLKGIADRTRAEVDERELEAVLNREFEVENLAGRLSNPAMLEYSRETPPAGLTREVHLGQVLDKHLKNQQQPIADEASKIARQAQANVRRAIAAELQSTLEDPGKPVAAVSAFLAAWQSRIDEFRKQARGRGGSHFDDARRRVKDLVLKALKRKAEEVNPLYKSLDTVELQDIDTVANEALNGAFVELVRPLLREALDKSLHSAAGYVRNRLKLLKHLSDSARSTLPKLGTSANGQPRSNEYFALPLFKLESPGSTSVEGLAELRSIYDEELLTPAVKQFLQASEDDSDPRMAAARTRFQSVLQDLEDDMDQFLTDYLQTYKDVFRQPLGATRPSDHLFYDPVRKIDERTEAQIAINQKRRYNDTLDVVISQHSDQTCIPELLEANAHRSHRPAITDDNEESNIWFQLHKFRYGFCLPALDDYDDYEQAVERYLARTDFNREDFWLDPDWHREYEKLMQRCREQAASSPAAPPAAAKPHTVLAGLLDYHRSFYRLLTQEVEARKGHIGDTDALVDYYRVREEATEGLLNADPMFVEDAARLAMERADQAAQLVGILLPAQPKMIDECLRELRTNCQTELEILAS